jgi:hypothetical protein
MKRPTPQAQAELDSAKKAGTEIIGFCEEAMGENKGNVGFERKLAGMLAGFFIKMLHVKYGLPRETILELAERSMRGDGIAELLSEDEMTEELAS